MTAIVYSMLTSIRETDYMKFDYVEIADADLSLLRVFWLGNKALLNKICFEYEFIWTRRN